MKKIPLDRQKRRGARKARRSQRGMEDGACVGAAG